MSPAGYKKKIPGDQAMDWGPFDAVEIPLSGHLQLEILEIVGSNPTGRNISWVGHLADPNFSSSFPSPIFD